MPNRKTTDILEIAIHIIIVLLGFIVLFVARTNDDVFYQSLLINIGSSLVVVTVLFFIFEFFRRRHEIRDQDSVNSNGSDLLRNHQSEIDNKAKLMINNLKNKQYSSPITNNSKTSDK
jgi:hypothetical protein